MLRKTICAAFVVAITAAIPSPAYADESAGADMEPSEDMNGIVSIVQWSLRHRQVATERVVQPGDTLWEIVGPDGDWRFVAALNDISDPDLIYPGDVLQVRTPTADEDAWIDAAAEAAYVQDAEAWQAAPRPEPETPEPPSAPVPTEPPAPALTQPPAPAPAPVPASSGSGVWDQLAQCESGGNWSINTGNGYYGGLQFSQSSWAAAGGSGMPHQASREEQIRVAENLLAMQGWSAWPACSSQLGLR